MSAKRRDETAAGLASFRDPEGVSSEQAAADLGELRRLNDEAWAALGAADEEITRQQREALAGRPVKAEDREAARIRRETAADTALGLNPLAKELEGILREAIRREHAAEIEALERQAEAIENERGKRLDSLVENLQRAISDIEALGYRRCPNGTRELMTGRLFYAINTMVPGGLQLPGLNVYAGGGLTVIARAVGRKSTDARVRGFAVHPNDLPAGSPSLHVQAAQVGKKLRELRGEIAAKLAFNRLVADEEAAAPLDEDETAKGGDEAAARADGGLFAETAAD